MLFMIIILSLVNFFVIMVLGIIFLGRLEWGGKALTVVLILAMIISVAIAPFEYKRLKAHLQMKAEEWNNGICPDCGSAYRFANADYNKNKGTIYYWTCDNCQKVIERTTR